MAETTSDRLKRVRYIEMMGAPGSYDASVYDDFEDKDNEGIWFQKRYGHLDGLSISASNVCIGEALPAVSEIDVLVLAGSYNSVHDDTDWQQRVRAWLPEMRAAKVPILAICGSHQLLAHMLGSGVDRFDDGPYAGTFSTRLTEAGMASPVMASIAEEADFHFANNEHVTSVPPGATLLASSGKVPVAALDFGDHCYSTQFHPEASDITLGAGWKKAAPELIRNYHDQDAGDQLVENFLRLDVG